MRTSQSPRRAHAVRDPFQDTTSHFSYGPSGSGSLETPLDLRNRQSSALLTPTNPPVLSIVESNTPGVNGTKRLPFFEAALARSRGESVPASSCIAISSPRAPVQPSLPIYFFPPDPNHPDLAVDFAQSSTIRLAYEQEDKFARGISRSPSPSFEDSLDVGHGEDFEYEYSGEKDVEKALLFGQTKTTQIDKAFAVQAFGERGWSEKLSSLGLLGGRDEGDLSLPSLGKLVQPNSALPEVHFQGPMDSTSTARSFGVVSGEMGFSRTQHFGPAPDGRVDRRTHNAAGHRRIKQSATLDENGFFAVDMPIPTRLAQFLPVKGVEEQKSTR